MASAGPLVSVNFGLNTESYKSSTRDLLAGNDKIINQMRWMGRDLMRVGGEVEKFANIMGGAWKFLIAQSSDMQAGLGEITWEFQDMADILGSSLIPLFDAISSVLEPIINWLDSIGSAGQQFIVLLIALTYFIPKVYSVFLKLGGFFSLLLGSWKALSSQGSVFKRVLGMIGEGLRMMIGLGPSTKALFAKQNKEIENLIKHDELLKKTWEEDRDSQKKGSKERKAASEMVATYTKQIKDLKRAQEVARIEGDALTKSEGKGEKGTKGILGKFKSLFKSLKNNKQGFVKLAGGVAVAGAAIGVMAIASAAMGPIMEALSPIMTSLSDAIQPIADAIAPLADDFAGWMDSLGSISTVVGVAIIAIGLLAAALLGAFGTVIATSITAALTSIGGAIAGAATSAASGAVTILAAIGPIGWVILAIIAALALFTIAWTQNWGDIQGKVADFVKWFDDSCHTVFDPLRNAWTSLTAWIGDSLATLNKIFQPLIDFFTWLAKILGLSGGTGAGLDVNGDIKITYAGEKPNIEIPPHAQKGGLVRREGLAYIHAAEIITPANQPTPGGNQIFITNTFENPVFTSSADMNRFADIVSEKLRKQLEAMGSGR